MIPVSKLTPGTVLIDRTWLHTVYYVVQYTRPVKMVSSGLKTIIDSIDVKMVVLTVIHVESNYGASPPLSYQVGSTVELSSVLVQTMEIGDINELGDT